MQIQYRDGGRIVILEAPPGKMIVAVAVAEYVPPSEIMPNGMTGYTIDDRGLVDLDSKIAVAAGMHQYLEGNLIRMHDERDKMRTDGTTD